PRRDPGPAAGSRAPAPGLRLRRSLPAGDIRLPCPADCPAPARAEPCGRLPLSRAGLLAHLERGVTAPLPLLQPAPVLSIEGLVVQFGRPRSAADLALGRRPPVVRAVDGVSLALAPREVLGLVGESGSGKTTIGRAILGLYAPSGGRILFEGRDIATLD